MQKDLKLKHSSSNIDEVIRPVDFFFFFNTIRFHKHKKA